MNRHRITEYVTVGDVTVEVTAVRHGPGRYGVIIGRDGVGVVEKDTSRPSRREWAAEWRFTGAEVGPGHPTLRGALWAFGRHYARVTWRPLR